MKLLGKGLYYFLYDLKIKKKKKIWCFLRTFPVKGNFTPTLLCNFQNICGFSFKELGIDSCCFEFQNKHIVSKKHHQSY